MNLSLSAAAASIIAAAGVHKSYAFGTHSSLAATKTFSGTSLTMGPPTDPSAFVTELYGKGGRKYRRTVYTHSEWMKHRSSDWFTNNLGTLLNSSIYRNVGQEVFATVSIAVPVCVWNALAGGYKEFSGVMYYPVLQRNWVQKVGLPLEAFTHLSSSLGLLLGEFL